NGVRMQARRLFLVKLPLMHRSEGLHSGERAFQLADVALHFMSDEVEHFFRNQAAVVAELGVEDGEAGLEIRRLDVGDETPFKSRAQPSPAGGDLLRRPVRRDDDLLADLVEGVEGVKELFIGLVLAGEKLDVVDEE